MLSQIAMTVKGTLVLLAAVHFFAALLSKEDAAWVKRAPRTIIVGLYLIGLWGHYVGTAYLALVLSIALLSRSRAEAAALYAVAIVSLPDLYWKPVFGGLYLFPFTKHLFSMLGLAVAFARHKQPIRLTSRFDLPILLVLILELAQARSGDATDVARLTMPIIFNIALPYFLISRSLNSPEDVRRFMLALAFGGFVMAIVATTEARLHWLLYKQIEVQMNIFSPINSFQQSRGGVLRAPASFPESTSLGTFIAMAGIMIIALRSSFASKGKWYIAVGVLLVGLIAPNSRGAFIGIGVGLLAFDLYEKRYGALALKAGSMAAIYMVMLIAAQFSPYIATSMGKGDTASSSEYRVLLLHRGLEEIRKHPVLGTTMKNALANLDDIRQGQHIIDLVNGYINYGLTLGYPGIVGLLAVFLGPCAAMLLARRRLWPSEVARNAAAAVFSIAAFMIIVSFFTGFGNEGSTPYYEVLAICGTVWALRRTELAGSGAQLAGLQVTAAPGIRGMILRDREAARLKPTP
jgi:hypothetical protein